MSDIEIYESADGEIRLNVQLDGETVWLSIDQMSDLFGRDKSTISRHIKNVFIDGELEKEAVVAKYATTAPDGKTYQVEHFNLDVIISVGYRVTSKQGVAFRQWATKVLREFAVKGFTLDDERLKDVASRRALLEGKGMISHKEAIKKAEAEFEAYRACEMCEFESDFDRAIKQLEGGRNEQD